MERSELWEWIALFVVILLWWPLVFLGWFPLPYKIFVYVASVATITIVTVRRVRRVREGLRYSQEILDAERRAQGPPPLERPRKGKS